MLLPTHADELRSEVATEAKHRHFAITEVQAACESMESRLLPEQMLEENRLEMTHRYVLGTLAVKFARHARLHKYKEQAARRC
jgi:hypothetical protein